MRFLSLAFLTFLLAPTVAVGSESSYIGPLQNGPSITGEMKRLDTVSNITLFSLEPPNESPNTNEAKDDLHGYKILGKTDLHGQTAKIVVHTLQNSVINSDHGQSLCMLEAHHAIRAIIHGHTYDYLICYICGDIAIFKDDKPIDFGGIEGSPSIFNSLLIGSKVPLAHIYRQGYTLPSDTKARH